VLTVQCVVLLACLFPVYKTCVQGYTR